MFAEFACALSLLVRNNSGMFHFERVYQSIRRAPAERGTRRDEHARLGRLFLAMLAQTSEIGELGTVRCLKSGSARGIKFLQNSVPTQINGL